MRKINLGLTRRNAILALIQRNIIYFMIYEVKWYDVMWYDMQ